MIGLKRDLVAIGIDNKCKMGIRAIRKRVYAKMLHYRKMQSIHKMEKYEILIEKTHHIKIKINKHMQEIGKLY